MRTNYNFIAKEGAVEKLNGLDVLLLLWFLRALLVGFRRGFWQSAAGLFSLGMGLWAAVKYRIDLARYLEEQLFLGPRLNNWLLKRLGIPSPGMDPETVSVPNQYLVELTREFPFSESLQKLINLDLTERVSAAGQQTAHKMLEGLTQDLTRLILDGAAFLLILFGVWFGISLLFMLLGFIMEKGMLGWVNRLLGGLFSMASQGLVLALIFGLLAPIWPVFAYLGDGKNTELLTTIRTSLETSQLVPILVNIYGLLSAWLPGSA